MIKFIAALEKNIPPEEVYENLSDDDIRTLMEVYDNDVNLIQYVFIDTF